ncbi:MAG: MFS transporter [Dehalococcoidales bacterium]|nr:MFS transporter [Dehalococcoidales bacterium]
MGRTAIGKVKITSAFPGVLVLFLLAHFTHHLVTALPAPLMPLIRAEFNLNYAQAGVLLSAFQLTYGISQLPAGWIADRIGARLSLTFGISGVALAGFAIGLSHTYVLMLVFLMLMGLLGGGYHPSSPTLITASVEPRNRGRALGFHSIGGSASFFIAPLTAAAISAAWGWRAPFIAMSVPTIIYGIIFYLLLQRLVKPPAVSPAATAHNIAPVTARGKGPLVAFMTVNAVSHAVMLAVISFIPLFAVDRFGIAKEAAGTFLSLYYGAGLWASLLGGYLADRFGTVPVFLTVCFLTIPAVYLLGVAPGVVILGVITFTLGILAYINMPVSEAYLVSHTVENRRSSILGLMYFCNIEGVMVVTLAMGYLIEKIGFNMSIAIAAGVVLITTVTCSIWLRNHR